MVFLQKSSEVGKLEKNTFDIMAGLATKQTDRSVERFIESIDHTAKQDDSKVIVKLIEDITGHKPKVWGNVKVPDFIIGFGKYKYQRKGSKEEFELSW